MAASSESLNQLVTSLVPMLSRSLAEQFNVFRVMHHGTHEKQLSNVFAWLLDVDGTHRLGDAFQRIFLEHVNADLPEENQLPISGYRVAQEVDTSGDGSSAADIADIVLTGPYATVVIENYEYSDGHGHDYLQYLEYGAAEGQPSVVVLLCVRHERQLQTQGWEQAVVVTYAEVLDRLRTHVVNDQVWRQNHRQQNFFLNQLFEHFLEGPRSMSTADQLAFVNEMCKTGESARYATRPHEAAAEEFADMVSQHARRQFEEARKTLNRIKRILRDFAERTLIEQVNSSLSEGQISGIAKGSWQGKWLWTVPLMRPERETIGLQFGPTAVEENNQALHPLENPDYTRVFVTRQPLPDHGIRVSRIIQTDISLEEVLTGLRHDDTRLRNAVLEAIGDR